MWCCFLIILGLCEALTQAFCPQTCVCEEAHPSVHCENAELSLVPNLLNPNLKRLNLAFNTIRNINEALQYYELLEELNLSHNDLISLESENFKEQNKLRTLNLSLNNLTRLESKVFSGLRSLVRLDLSQNSISDVSKAAFDSTPNLKILIISKNKLHHLHPATFKSLTKLKLLNLCDNYLREVPRESLASLENLENLKLCRNRLTYIKNNDINISSLVTLFLESNIINIIDPNALKYLINLKNLNLNENLLDEIPRESLHHLHNLEFLDVGRNRLVIIRNDDFRDLINLKKLQISRCAFLERIESQSFTELANLKTLTISHNPSLEFLPQNLLYFSPSLANIDLKQNGFRTLSENSFPPIRNLKSLDVRNNPIVCNCSLLWLGILLNQQNRSVDVSDVLCNGPDKLRGVYLSRVTSNEVLCVNILMQVTIGVAVTVISSLLLVGLFYLICRYRRRPKMNKLSNSCWIEGHVGPIEPWAQEPLDYQQTNASHRLPPSSTHIIQDEYFYHTFPTLRKVPVTEV